MLANLKALAAAVLNAGGTMPAFVMNPLQAIAVAFASNGLPYAVVDSAEMEAGTVIAVDAPSFASAIGRAEVDASRDAAVHEEDSAPQPINAGTMATPIRSFFQTDTIGVRVLMDAAWGLPTGRTAWIEGVSW
jgi:hypothetical protein